MSPRKPVVHTPIATERGSISDRLAFLEGALKELVEKIPRLIASGSLATGKKIYREVYEDLAKEHGRVFEVQEAGVMRLAESLHARICILESQSGIASPDLAELRALVDQIAEEVGTEESREYPDDGGELASGDGQHEPEDMDGNPLKLSGADGGEYQGVNISEREYDRAKGIQ